MSWMSLHETDTRLGFAGDGVATTELYRRFVYEFDDRHTRIRGIDTPSGRRAVREFSPTGLDLLHECLHNRAPVTKAIALLAAGIVDGRSLTLTRRKVINIYSTRS